MMIFFIRFFLQVWAAIFDNRLERFILYMLKTTALAALFGLAGRIDNMQQTTSSEVSVVKAGRGQKKSIDLSYGSDIR